MKLHRLDFLPFPNEIKLMIRKLIRGAMDDRIYEFEKRFMPVVPYRAICHKGQMAVYRGNRKHPMNVAHIWEIGLERIRHFVGEHTCFVTLVYSVGLPRHLFKQIPKGC